MELLETTSIPWAQGVGRSNRPAPTIESVGESLGGRFYFGFQA